MDKRLSVLGSPKQCSSLLFFVADHASNSHENTGTYQYVSNEVLVLGRHEEM